MFGPSREERSEVDVGNEVKGMQRRTKKKGEVGGGHVGRFMWRSMLDFLGEGRKEGVGLLRKWRMMCNRNVSQPIRIASRNKCQVCFCIGLHVALFGDHIFLCSDCTCFFDSNMIQCFWYRIALRAQPNKFVSSTSTSKPQPQHGLGMSNWAQQSSIND